LSCPACQHRFELHSVRSSSETSIASTTVDEVPADSIKRSVSEIGNLEKLGRYEIRGVLGEGGFGRVYRAYDPQLDREVALKVPLYGYKDKVRTQRFLTEAKAAGKLQHPSIVPTYDSGHIDGRPFIASAFIEGKPLSELVRRGKIGLRQAAEWVRDLSDALAYAHQSGIVHRDIKPHNVMIDELNEPHLMDFGLAKRSNEDSSVTTDGSLLGTPAYMSPEQAKGQLSKVGPASDQYSLGVVLFELLTGRKPFEGSPHVVIGLVASQDPPKPRSIRRQIPMDIEAICLMAMNRDPDRRYADCAAFAKDLTRWLEGRSTLARPLHSLERGLRWLRRHAVVSGLSTVIIVLLTMFTVVLFVETSKTDLNVLEVTNTASFPPLITAHPTIAATQPETSTIAPSSVTDTSQASKTATDTNSPAFQQWMSDVAALNAEEQIKAISKKLMELNSGFDGTITDHDGTELPKIENGVITGIGIVTDSVTDISPIRALKGLVMLSCGGSDGGQGQLADLSPLKGMRLSTFACQNTKVSDLSSLVGMNLESLQCDHTPVSDLRALKGMPLTTLSCQGTQISELSILHGMNLAWVGIESTRVSDLSVLQGMPITELYCNDTEVTDLAALKGMPLRVLYCRFNPTRDAEVLRSIETLETINGKPAVQFWKEYDAEDVDMPVTQNASSPETTDTGWHGWPAEAPQPAIAPFDVKQAKKHQKDWAAYLKVPIEWTNSIGMKFRLIPPGEFAMGSDLSVVKDGLALVGDNGQWMTLVRSEATRHIVRITQPIYLGIHEVRQKDYKSIVGHNPSIFASMGREGNMVKGLDTSNHPVERTSWYAAVDFCTKLSEKEQLNTCYMQSGQTVTLLNGNGYRLPTEAEWEYSCRAGATTKYSTGDDDTGLTQAAWIGRNSGGRTHPVGALKANSFGIHDMHGNVWEWVQDWWAETYYQQFQEKPAIDPQGPVSGDMRVVRGGDRNPDNRPFFSRASLRYACGPTVDNFTSGFRVTLTVDAVKAAIAEPAKKKSTASKASKSVRKGQGATADQ